MIDPKIWAVKALLELNYHMPRNVLVQVLTSTIE